MVGRSGRANGRAWQAETPVFLQLRCSKQVGKALTQRNKTMTAARFKAFVFVAGFTLASLAISPIQAGPSSCDGDANGDGAVDPLDSGFVLARFGCLVGTGDPNCDAADVNGDGNVDPLDSGYVLARFGPCPEGPVLEVISREITVIKDHLAPEVISREITLLKEEPFAGVLSREITVYSVAPPRPMAVSRERPQPRSHRTIVQRLLNSFSSARLCDIPLPRSSFRCKSL